MSIEALHKKQYRGGRVPKQFSFTYADYAGLFGLKVAAVRQAVRRKLFDPKDLADVLRFAKEKEHKVQ